MSLRKRGRVWWFRFSFNGQVVEESTRTGSKTVARDCERQRRREIEESWSRYGRIDRRQTPATFGVAAKQWLDKRTALEVSTRETYQFALKHLNQAFNSWMIGDINSKAISSYQRSRLEQGAAGATVNKEFTVLASILADRGLWQSIRRDVKRVEENESAGRALLTDEEAHLLKAASEVATKQGWWSPVYTVTVLGLNTGLRHSEVRRRRWQDIDLEKRVLIVGKTKSEAGSGRPIPLTAAAHAALDMWSARFPNRKPLDYVFPACENGHVDVTRPISHWRTAWTNCCKLAGLPGLRYHDLRHSAATKLLESGTPMATVAAILGWSASTAIRMAKRYGHIRPDAQRRALDSINTPLSVSSAQISAPRVTNIAHVASVEPAMHTRVEDTLKPANETDFTPDRGQFRGQSAFDSAPATKLTQ
jgi:integrase